MVTLYHLPRRPATAVAALVALLGLVVGVEPAAASAEVQGAGTAGAGSELLVPLGDVGGVAVAAAGPGEVTRVVDLPAGPDSSPWGVAAGPDGSVWISDAGAGTVERIDPDDWSIDDGAITGPGLNRAEATSKEATLERPRFIPRGLTVGTDGRLWVVDAGTGRVLGFPADDEEGPSSEPDLQVPADGAVGPDRGALVDPVAIVIGADGTLLVSDRGDDDIERFDPGTGAHLGTAATLEPGDGPAGLALAPDGRLLVALSGRGSVVAVDPATGEIGEPLIVDLVEPTGVAIDDRGALWVGDRWTGTVTAHDVATGRATGDTLSTGHGPRLLAAIGGPEKAEDDPSDGPEPPTNEGEAAPDGDAEAGGSFPAGDRTDRWLDDLGDPAEGVTFAANDGSADEDVDYAVLSADYDVVVADGDVALVSEGSSVSEAVVMEVVGGSSEPVAELLDRSPVAADVPGEGGDVGAVDPSIELGPAPPPGPAEPHPSQRDDDDAIEFDEVLPGIDVVYSANGDDVEYSFVIESGAKPGRITLDFGRALGLRLEPSGDLLIEAESGPDFLSTAPTTFQEIDGKRKIVESRYVLRDDGTVGFELGPYDPALPVIIDPTFEAVDATGGGTFLSGETLDLPVPAGVASGDVLIAQVAYNAPDPSSIGPPPGWNTIDVLDHPTEALIQGLYWRVATGSEPAQHSFTLTAGGTGKASGAIGAYRGVDTANPVDAFGGQSSTTSDIVAPSITTTVSDTTLIGFFAARDGGPITTAAGMTEQWEAASGGGGPSSSQTVAEAADEQLGAPGPTGTRTASFGAVQAGIGHLVALAPSGAPSDLVMVTGTGDFTGANDSAKKALFESFGWTVTGIDDDSSPAAFTAAATANDVLFVSDTANSGVASSVRGLDIGLVTEHFAAWENFLYSGEEGQRSSSQTTVNVVDNTHYITAPLATGSLTIHTASDDLNYWKYDEEPLPAAVLALAEAPSSSNHDALLVAEAGATLYSGNTAVDRRVWFPSDGSDPALWTADYETLLERSLDWAAGTALSTVTVNSAADSSDTSPGDDVCNTGGTNADGDPECTLRAAIEEANASASVDTIHFLLPTSDPGYSASPLSYTLTPTSGYPLITSPVTIDATTQPGWISDPIVQLDGSSASGATAGLALRANDSTISGFIVHSFPDEGLEIDGSTGSGDNNTLSRNWVGLNASGAVIGNVDDGILVTVDASDNVIGGTGATDGNRVAGSGGAGINVRTTSFDNAVLGNQVWANVGIGIDLDDDGVTANDPDDVDGGSNDGLNFPELTSVVETSGTISVDFDLDVPAGNYRVEFFANPSGADPSGNGEGQSFVHATAITHTGSGSEPFSTSFPGATGDVITATATEDLGVGTYGPTSEYSPASTALSAVVTVNSSGDASDATPGDDVCDTGGTNSGGDPACTLRAAIEEANASTLVATIHFAMPATEPGHSGGIWTIAPGSAFQSLTGSVTIDGSTQTGWTATPAVELDGTSAGGSTDGFAIAADDVTIRSLAINRFGADGIEVEAGAADATVVGNHIGLDASGSIDRGNGARGIDLQSGSGPTTIGGTTAADRNVISGNGGDGIIVWNSNDNVIIGNHIGTDVTGNAPLGNDADGIAMGGGTSGTVTGQPGAGNVLSGNGDDGFENDATGPNNSVQANTIGLGADGSTVVANGRYGVVIYNGANNTLVGGSGAGEGNVISGNVQSGVIIDGNSNAATTANTIAGNLIGTDATGSLDRGNGAYGVDFFAGANGNTIGGPTAAHGNVVAGNGSGEGGIRIIDPASSNNVIRFNTIGVDRAGTNAVPNNLHGIRIEAPNTQVLDNLVAGNDVHGVYVYGGDATGTQILRNSIGTNATQSAEIPNGFDGVRLEGGSSGTTVGSAGNGNTISGNAMHGVNINSSNGNIIQANYIGTKTGGTLDLGNIDAGVYADVYNSSNNVIGGTGAGEGNTIAFNGEGIRLESGTGNAILANVVYANTGLGIDLNDDGVTANDAGDADTGPNDLLNFPVIDSVQRVGSDLIVDVSLDAPAGDYRIELFANPTVDPSGHGEGAAPLGGSTVTHTGGGSETFTLSATSGATVLTATATEDLGGGSHGSTSELSAGMPSPDLVIVNSTGDGGDAALGDGRCDTGGVNADGEPECTLRAAIAEANDPGTPVDTIRFAIPTTDPGHAAGVWTIGPGSALPSVDDTTTIDGTTQTGWAANTQLPSAGLDGTQVIVLDGSGAGAADGLVLDGDAILVTGIVIGGFDGHGMAIGGNGTTVTASAIGADAAGTGANPNSGDGIHITGSTASVGGPTLAEGVLVANNGGDGIEVAAGTGGLVTGVIIEGNTGDGVSVSGAAAEVATLGNSIVGNGELAIDLAGGTEDGAGVTADDPGDGDVGPNDLLNRPDLGTASVSGGTITVTYRLDLPAGTYRLELFTNPSGADPSGAGEAENLVGTAAVVHGGAGPASGRVDVAGGVGTVITATITADLGGGAYGPTSEVSDSVTSVSLSSLMLLDSSTRRSDAVAAGDDFQPVTAATDGVAGGALALDGDDDRLVGPGLDVTSGGLTLAAWVRPDTLTGIDRLVSKRDGAGNPIYELAVDGGTGEAVATLGVAGGVTARGGSVGTGAWHQLVASWDGADLILYVDGAEVDRSAASGTLPTDVGTNVVIGGRTDTSGFDGLVDHVVVRHGPTGADAVATDRTAVVDGALIQVGEQQSGVPGPWAVSGARTRTGSFSLLAPEISTGTGAAWAVATGIDEVGVAFRSWWWSSTATGVDLASGTRAGSIPTDQFESALTSPSGWLLRHRSGASEVVDGGAAGIPTPGSWIEVEVQTDQNGDSRVLIDGAEAVGWTAQGGDPASGSVGWRTGLLPIGERWYVDDPTARRLVTPEPVTSLGPLDRE